MSQSRRAPSRTFNQRQQADCGQRILIWPIGNALLATLSAIRAALYSNGQVRRIIKSLFLLLEQLYIMERISLVGAQFVRRAHSNTFLKRIKKNPQMVRQQRERQGLPAKSEGEMVPELLFKPTYVPGKVSYNGWSPPPPKPMEGLPFKVNRTASMQLPVYSDIKNGGTRDLTILRKYEGDAETLAQELSAVCGGLPVTQFPGRLEVKGRHATKVKKWLVGLGF